MNLYRHDSFFAALDKDAQPVLTFLKKYFNRRKPSVWYLPTAISSMSFARVKRGRMSHLRDKLFIEAWSPQNALRRLTSETSGVSRLLSCKDR
jgi:hypothetical protein